MRPSNTHTHATQPTVTPFYQTSFLTGAAAGDYYAVASASGVGAGAYIFGLLRVGVADASGNVVSTGSYTQLVGSYTLCTLACDKAKAADSGGKAAIFFFSVSMLFMLIAAISMSTNAHIKLGRQVTGYGNAQVSQCLKMLGSPLMSLIFGGLALFCHVVACACGWGTIGGLAEVYAQSRSFSLIVALPGAGLAGWSLFLLLLSVILEVSSRSCCKDWKPPSAALNPSGSTTIVVTSPIASVAMVPPPCPWPTGGCGRQTGRTPGSCAGANPFSPRFFFISTPPTPEPHPPHHAAPPPPRKNRFFNPQTKETVWQLPPGALMIG